MGKIEIGIRIKNGRGENVFVPSLDANFVDLSMALSNIEMVKEKLMSELKKQTFTKELPSSDRKKL